MTAADEAGEALILGACASSRPDMPMVAEEAVAAGRVPEVGDGPFWLVDPLDGTKEFITRNGEFTVNIALVEDGEPVLGVVYAPALRHALVGRARPGRDAGARAAGAARSTRGRAPAQRRGRGRQPLAPRRRDRRLARPRTASPRRVSAGSSLKFCLVAEGRADVYPALRPDHGVGHRRRPRRARRGRRHGSRPRTARRSATASRASAIPGSSPAAPEATARGGDMASAWPNLFIVGAAKAGTTSLAYYLSQHADVFMSKMKEPHYFSAVRPEGKFAHAVPVVSDEASYLRLFQGADGVHYRGEASTSYLWSEAAAARIAERSPDARIIAVLREPIERLHSHYLNELREGIETRPIERAVREDFAATAAGAATTCTSNVGSTVASFEHYVQAFPPRPAAGAVPGRAEEPRPWSSQALRFLGIDPTAAAQMTSPPRTPTRRRRAGWCSSCAPHRSRAGCTARWCRRAGARRCART